MLNFYLRNLHRKEGLLERDCDKLVRNDRVYGHHVWLSVEMQTQWLQEIQEDIHHLLKKLQR